MPSDAWLAEIRAHRAARVARLASETGWLALVERLPLDPGDNETPLGRASFAADGAVALRVTPGLTVTAADAPSVPLTEFVWPAQGPAAAAILLEGTRRWELLRQADRAALRARDAGSPDRVAFAEGRTALAFYPPDERYRIGAALEPAPPGATMVLHTGLGAAVPHALPGTLRFTIAGQALRLAAVIEDEAPDRLFILFGDLTNRDATYQAGRFLYAPLPDAAGRVPLDFNLAFNPPCALTPYAACPLPTASSRLPVRIEAGEKRFGSG